MTRENYSKELWALFAKADINKKAIGSARPLSISEVVSLQNYFKIGLTYASNALEGNTLTMTETKVLLEDGLTVGGKPIRESYEAIGHAKAYDFMLEAAKKVPFDITEDIIKRLHFLFYSSINHDSAGVYRKTQVFITGTEYIPPVPGKVPFLMQDFIRRINNEKPSMHPIEYAARLHKGLVDIHPFEDGNGRTARLLMNLALVNAGYGIAIIPPVMRFEYIDALRASQRPTNPDINEFMCLVARCVVETQRDYCRLLNIEVNNWEPI